MGKKSKPKQNKKKPNKKPTATKSQNQRDQESDKSLVTLFTEAPESIQSKIKNRAQKVQDSKKARPENYTPSPIQESYPFSTAKWLKHIVSVLAQKKSSPSSETVRDYLNNRVSGDDLRFQIFKNEDLKQIPGVPQDSFEILLEALDSVGESSFHFWVCFDCSRPFLDIVSFVDHVNKYHFPVMDNMTRYLFPGKKWVDEFLDPRFWKPKVALQVFGEMPEGEVYVFKLDPFRDLQPEDALEVIGGMLTQREACVVDVELSSLDAGFWKRRDALLENVKELLESLMEKECLSACTMRVVEGHTLNQIGEGKILVLGGSRGPGGSLKFVGVSQLEKIEWFLKKLVNKETELEKATLAIGYGDADAEIVGVVDEWWEFVFRAEKNLVVDLQLLLETLGYELEELNVDVVVDWLYTFPPRARFKSVSVQEWRKGKETRRDMAVKILKSIKQEYMYTAEDSKRKLEHMNDCLAFGRFCDETQKDVEVLRSAFGKYLDQEVAGSEINVDADLVPAIREFFLLMQPGEGSNDNNPSIKMIRKRETWRVLELMETEISKVDVKTMKHLAKVKQLKLELAHTCFVDYLPALVPIVQTYLRQALEMSNAACEVPTGELGSDGLNFGESDPAPKEDEKQGDHGEEPVIQDKTAELYPKEREGDHGLERDEVVVESDQDEPMESQKQVNKEAAQTVSHSNVPQDEKGPGDAYCSGNQMQAAKETTDVGSSSARIEALKAAEFSIRYQDPSQVLKTKWIRGFTNNTSSTEEDFWALYDNVPHPSKMLVGTYFYCFKHEIVKQGLSPLSEDPVCADGWKWVLSCCRGNSDTWWKLTLIAITEEQFDDSDDICGATLNVQEKQEKISLWVKKGLSEDCQLRIGKQWKKLLDYKDSIIFILHEI